ncbi:hypothetical protein PgNI_10775, partial [Pyricularia grisea]|uniref:Uncharacterized protein n=1 Tax=Pyricularia grisea TaxID=148305 RepID=A0A6P8AYS6_PYRGI
ALEILHKHGICFGRLVIVAFHNFKAANVLAKLKGINLLYGEKLKLRIGEPKKAYVRSKSGGLLRGQPKYLPNF